MWEISTIMMYLGVAAILAGCAFILKKIHSSIRILLIAGTFIMLILSVVSAQLIVEQQTPSSTGLITLLTATYLTMIVITTFVFFYFGISGFVSLLAWLKPKNNQEKITP